MPKPPFIYFRTLASDKAVRHLYSLRNLKRPLNGERSRPNVLVATLLLVLTACLLLKTSWIPQDIKSYISSRTGIKEIEASDVSWLATPLLRYDCPAHRDCFHEAIARAVPESTELATIDRVQMPATWNSGFIDIRTVVSTRPLQEFKKDDNSTFSLLLPDFSYYRAQLLIDGKLHKELYASEQVATSLDAGLLDKPELVVDLRLQVTSSERPIAGLRNLKTVLVANQSEFQSLNDFIGSLRTKSIGSTGELAKVVIALFCLLLFLIIDSSPESLGLALFMGFEAAAMGIGQNWLPLGWLGIERSEAIVNYCYQMGDLTKLYFLFQMARIGSTSSRSWLVWGTLASIPYGFFMQYAGDHAIDWVYRIPRTRDTIVGVAGFLLCFRVLWAIRRENLPWRKVALVLAGTAALFEAINSWIVHSNLYRIYPEAKTIFTVFQANIGYAFALSTFLNISTLENRVRSLSKAKAKAEVIERELEIGQLVQKSLLKMPKLPDGVQLVCHHEAALYVSGDTYYVNWDAQNGIVTFLVNDVTGHGVQAALKASACNVLAKTVWEGTSTYQSRPQIGTRLRKFDHITQEMLFDMQQMSDFNSLVGAEFHLATGRLAIYRSNFTFPILISPNFEMTAEPVPVLGEAWSPSVVAVPNQDFISMQIQRGSFLLLMSDGFLESSREVKNFIQYLRRSLATRAEVLDVDIIRDIVLSYSAFETVKIADDRTLLIFQWQMEKAGQKANPVEEENAESSGPPLSLSA